jgi:glucose/arabinose dehydrogenase
VAAVLAATLAVSAACTFGPPDPDVAGEPPNLPAPSAEGSGAPGGTGDDDQEVVVTVLAKGLDVPWGMAFLPGGGALVTERDTARILQVGPQIDVDGLKVTEVDRMTEVVSGGDGGLLGIAVSPDYKTDQTVYVYYTTAKDNRIAKMKLNGKPSVILSGIPKSDHDNGGQLAFGPDGFLYARRRARNRWVARSCGSPRTASRRRATRSRPPRSGRPVTATCRASPGTRRSGCTRASPTRRPRAS